MAGLGIVELVVIVAAFMLVLWLLVTLLLRRQLYG